MNFIINYIPELRYVQIWQGYMSQELTEPVNFLLSRTGLSGAVEEFLTKYFNDHGDNLPLPGLYDRIIQEVERPLLLTTLKAVRGNQKKAAEILGINRNTLRKKIIGLSIDLKEF
jgi:DNA-binding protein Fis